MQASTLSNPLSSSRIHLRHKVIFLAAGVLFLMLLTGFISILLVNQTTHSMQSILNENQLSYNLQQALSSEKKAFAQWVQSGTFENRMALQQACSATKQALQQLPFDYTQIGAKRYEATWTVQNSYRTYQKERDKFLQASPTDEGYVTQLYELYAMQDYLSDYANLLNSRVMQAGNTSYEQQSALFMRLPYLLTGVIVAATLALFLVLYSSLASLVKGLNLLADAAGQMEQHNYSFPDLTWHTQDEMGQLVRAFNQMKHSTQENHIMAQRLHQKELDRLHLEKRFAAAQFQALKNQLNPHFLFNTLNTISRMARLEGAPSCEQMTLAVSRLLRYHLRTNDPVVPLSAELKIVDEYIYIQQMRFGSRVRYRLDCKADTSVSVPSFLLQPLVENAIQHGLSKKETGGSVCICVRQRENRLFINVTDTGTGMTPQRLAMIRQAMVEETKEPGIGLCNLGRRIHGLYTDAKVSVHSKEGHGTAILMEFGCQSAE